MYEKAIKHRPARQFAQSPAVWPVGEQQINRFLAVFIVVVGGVSAPESPHLLWLLLFSCIVAIVDIIFCWLPLLNYVSDWSWPRAKF